MGAAWRGVFAQAPQARRSQREAHVDGAKDVVATVGAPVSARVEASSAPRSTIERVYAHREELFVCAVQLLDDAHAAQQVVGETLEKALLGVKENECDAEPQLERTLDRLLVSLSLVRLKALPPPVLPGPPRGFRVSSAAEAMASSFGSSSSGFSTSAGGAGSDRPSSDRELEASDGELGEGSQFARTAQVLTSLPVEARVAVTLVVMQGRSLADAAFLLGTTEAACRFFLNHGRKLLRRALQRDLLTSDGEGRAAALLEKLTSGTTTLHDLRRSKKATIRA